MMRPMMACTALTASHVTAGRARQSHRPSATMIVPVTMRMRKKPNTWCAYAMRLPPMAFAASKCPSRPTAKSATTRPRKSGLIGPFMPLEDGPSDGLDITSPFVRNRIGESPQDTDRAARGCGDTSRLHGPAPRSEPPGRHGRIHIGDQQPFLAVRLPRKHRPVRMHYCRCRRRSVVCVVDAREITAVLGGAAQHRLLVKRVKGITEAARMIATRFDLREMRMEHDVRTALRGPTHRLGIAPPLVADSHAELQRTNLEALALDTRGVETLLRRVQLHLVLETGNRSVAVDDQRSQPRRAVDHALRSKHHRDARVGRHAGDR